MTDHDALRRKYPTLSVLSRTGPGCLSFYDGDDPEAIAQVSGGGLFCSERLTLPDAPRFDPLPVADPRLEFYRISSAYRNDRDDMADLEFRAEFGAWIARGTVLGDDVRIGPGSVVRARRIGDRVRIGAGVVIHSNVDLHDDVVIEASSVIGATGLVWMWHGDEKVYLEQTGGVEIQSDSFIGSNITVVRGGPNSVTRIGRHCCIAHGTMIGHDCQIADLVHMANNVAIAGSAVIGTASFIGSGASVVPGAQLGCEVILGAGAVLTKSAESYGVYQGNPARWVKSSKGRLSGVPRWRQ